MLPGVTIGTSYGTPALKVGTRADGSGGKLLARLRAAEEPCDLVLRCEAGLREALLENGPDVFYLTPHYESYDWILVRLAVADPEQIAGLVARAWTGLAPAKLRRERV